MALALGGQFFGFHNLPQIFLALALMEAANDIARNDTLVLKEMGSMLQNVLTVGISNLPIR